MTDQQLHDLIFADATAKALADAGNDTAAAERASAIAPKVPVSTLVTERTVYAAFANPADGEAVLQALEAAGQQNVVVARAIKWLKPGEGGLDVGHLATRGMLDFLQSQGVLTAGQVATIKAIGEQRPQISPSDVSRVWAVYRPEGQVQ